MTVKSRSGYVMVVDDQPADRKLLEEVLERQGYEVRSFPSGLLALEAAAQSPPDLVLLDVAMPELDGYEVCERLKSDLKLSSIPIIFLSVLDQTEDKVRAFQAGAVDYISKPLHLEEVQARVETQLKVHDLQKALAAQNQHLEEAVAARTAELAQAHQKLTVLDRAKDDFLRTISHELRTPLNGLLGASEIVFDELSLTGKNVEFRNLYEQSRQRLVSLLDDALLLTEIDVNGEKLRSSPVSVTATLDRAVAKTREFAASHEMTLESAPADLGYVWGQPDLLVRAFHALLETTVKLSDRGGTVRLTHQALPGSVKVLMNSEGRTIPATVIPKFFDIFSVGEQIAPGEDFGLGPPVAARILSLFGGTIAVTNRDNAGISLTMEFPTTSFPSPDPRP